MIRRITLAVATLAAIAAGLAIPTAANATLAPIPVGSVRGHLICPPGRLWHSHSTAPIHCRLVD